MSEVTDYGNLQIYEGLYCSKCDKLLGYADSDPFDFTFLCEKCIDELETKALPKSEDVK